MKNMHPDVIRTAYGELTVDLVKTLILSPHTKVEGICPHAEIVAHAIHLADQLVAQLNDREAAAKAYAEATRVFLPVDWAPDAQDDANRGGQHWSQPEVDALIAQFKNGQTGPQIAVHHRRTWTAISAQLGKYGLVIQEGRGNGWVRADGEPWEL